MINTFQMGSDCKNIREIIDSQKQLLMKENSYKSTDGPQLAVVGRLDCCR